ILLMSGAVEPRVLGQGANAGQHWVGSWFASSTARMDPLATTTPAPTPNAPPGPGPALVIPPAVLAVAPHQELTVGGQSPLHFKNQTLRQIAHLSRGGSRLRVVLSNTFGTAPLAI